MASHPVRDAAAWPVRQRQRLGLGGIVLAAGWGREGGLGQGAAGGAAASWRPRTERGRDRAGMAHATSRPPLCITYFVTCSAKGALRLAVKALRRRV